MIDAHSGIAILRPIDLVLDVKTISVTVDEEWSPYCQATIVCELPAGEDRAAIDLRDTELRLDLRLRQDFGQPWSVAEITTAIGGGDMADLTTLLDGEPLGGLTNRFYVPWNSSTVRASGRRVFDLLVTNRQFDDVSKELTITAASDEAILHDDALISATALDPGTTSALAIVQQVLLTRYGTSLVAGALDTTVAELEATLWQPAVTAWDYLDSLLEPASLRLWCDEVRRWNITERQATVPGAVVITPAGTMTGLVDKMTLDPDIWFRSVIVEYRWTDDLELNQVAYDYSGTDWPVLRVKRTTPYPGPGTAAGILNRAQGRGRVLDVRAVNDYTVEPGIAATINPVDTDAQSGYVSAVEWRLPAAEMDVKTRGLVDTPETAWLFVPVGIAWTDVDPGLSWDDYTPALIGA